MSKILKRTEYLGTKDGEPVWGRDYYINTSDEIIVDRNFNPYYTAERYENEIDNEKDSFADGGNDLREIDGVLYEVNGNEHTMFRLRRKAYLSEEDALK